LPEAYPGVPAARSCGFGDGSPGVATPTSIATFHSPSACLRHTEKYQP
jgi:hypothetical protein